jgi:DNA-binding MarR family transcriptional regulator
MTRARAPSFNRSPRTASARRIEEVEAAFIAQYPGYQYHAVEFLTAHLVDVSRQFGGDFQEMLLLAVIGQVHLHRMLTQPDAQAGDAEPASISASRLADVTGIPRQTVRRKLAALAGRGWIEQTASAAWRLTVAGDDAPARLDLDGLNRRSIRRMAELFANLEGIAQPAQPPPAEA